MIYRYLACWGADYIHRMRPLTFEQLLGQQNHPPGTYVFGDLDRTTADQRAAAAEVWQRMHDQPDRYRLLNHPTRSLRRYDLLRTLTEEGLNRHKVYRVTDGVVPERYPVFVRRENDHGASRSDLLADAEALTRKLDQLRARHADLTPWMIVEFLDTSDADGFYRSYSSFIFDGVIIPHHLMFDRWWVIKGQHSYDAAHLAEEMAYMTTDMHRDEMRRVFELAKIDFGRIDYSFYEQKMEVWEINTSSVILNPAYEQDEARRQVHDIFHDGFSAVLDRLLEQGPTPARPASPSLTERIVTRSHIAFERFRVTPLGAKMRWAYRRLRGEPK